MKKFLLSILSLTIALSCFSQNATNDSLMCLPTRTFRAIAKDLLKGDSAIAILNKTNEEIVDMQNLLVLKDSTIVSLTKSHIDNKNIIDNLYDNNRLMADEIEYSRKKDVRQEAAIKNFGVAAFIFLVLAILK